MMNIDDDFDRENLAPLEAILMGQPLAQDYFRGELFQEDGVHRFKGITLETPDLGVIDLDEEGTGRLFMIPDGSIVWTRLVAEEGDAPAGLDVMSNNPFMADDEYTSVIAYRSDEGSALAVDALYVRRLMLLADAPSRLATVSFGLMAISAYRHGFHHISLMAAGDGPVDPGEDDRFVGYAVWPKFGFDAPLEPVDLNAAPTVALRACRSVQEVISVDPAWWENNGRGRPMRFDLMANSQSWRILLDYLCEVLPLEPDL